MHISSIFHLETRSLFILRTFTDIPLEGWPAANTLPPLWLHTYTSFLNRPPSSLTIMAAPPIRHEVIEALVTVRRNNLASTNYQVRLVLWLNVKETAPLLHVQHYIDFTVDIASLLRSKYPTIVSYNLKVDKLSDTSASRIMLLRMKYSVVLDELGCLSLHFLQL